MQKSFFIETFGCQMNRGDSELMRLSLRRHGFQEANSKQEADICLFNTCSVRQHAEDRAISKIEAAKNSKAGKKKTVVIVGCAAQRVGNEIVASGKADLAIGPYEAPNVGEIIAAYISNSQEEKNIFLSQSKEDFQDRLHSELIESREENGWHKWVTITHGCENYCTFCIVPHVRGKLISFPSARIIDFVKDLSARGIFEITLLGQNVNQYGKDSGDIPFYKLLEEVAKIKGILKINFLTSHPMDFSGEIIRVMSDYANISRGIHLPLQSGSNEILKRMNRKYTLESYMDIVEAIDSGLPDYALSTDLIVGFPGESEEQFNETLEAVKKIGFVEAFMYAYSPRSGTLAAKMRDELPRNGKIERLNRLISIQRKISLEKLKMRMDRIEYAIAEKISKKSADEVSGRTGLNQTVVFKGGKEDIGRPVKIKISGIRGSTLFGEKIHS